ncbi:MAG TPA: DUF4410 domain-containing protein [Candidatus Binataceae bacterium]|nr:DUF4410 domain-containing protein [Candidatus Binataceae bacterium]
MKTRLFAVALIFVSAVIAGCATTRVTYQTPPSQQAVARPNQIWVYNFVATPADMPADSSIRNDISSPSTAMTQDQIDQGRRLGELIAQHLVVDIQAMGFTALLAGRGSTPQVGDGMIRGYLVSAEGGGAGNAAKRFVIGFGYGTAEMDTVVEGYVMTSQGLRKLGSGTLTSSGNKTPGVIVPAAVAIATGNPIGLIVVGGAKLVGEASGRNSLDARAKATANQIAAELKLRFQDRGWIS